MEAGRVFCPGCDRKIRRIPPGRCVRCQQLPGPVCAACAATRSALEACVAEVLFEGEVEDWIHRFKYPQRGLAGLDAAPGAVARRLAVEASSRTPGPLPDLVVPVPLHPSRLRSRGFNPAGLLARAVARERRLPFDPVALRRIRDTPSQTGLGRPARRRNVRGAFEVRDGLRVPERIWLVDDVVTTGSTLGEVARVLRGAGAKSVVGVCAARTP